MGCASLCNWKSIFGFSAYLVVHIFAAGMIGLAIEKTFAECLHIKDKHLHIYLYGASLTAVFTSWIHLIIKCRCIEDPDEDDPIQQYHHERQYTVTTFFIILPNLAWLIFGSVVAIKSLDPPPTHELTGPGLYPPNYCYWGLWRLFHLCLIISAIFIILSFILVAIMWRKVRNFRSTNHRRESSWANYRPGDRKERNQSLKSFTAPAGNVNYSDPFDTNRY